MAFISMLLILKLPETLVQRSGFRWSMLKIKKSDIISAAVFVPTFITFLAYFAFGMVLTLIPDWSDFLGFQNKGSFFVAFTIASLTIRFLAGSASDKMGRRFIVNIGLLILLSALLIMAFVPTKNGLLMAAIIYGLSMGVLSPALNAWTVDLSPSKERGKGISTMFIALEAGIGLGALLSGWYYQSNYQKIPDTMLGCAFLAVIGLVFLAYPQKKGKH